MKTPSTLVKNAVKEVRFVAEVILACSVRIALTGRLRRHAAVAASLDSAQPSALTIEAPEVCAVASVGSGSAQGPLSVIAR